MQNKFYVFMATLFLPYFSCAQFHTITKTAPIISHKRIKPAQALINQQDTLVKDLIKAQNDSIAEIVVDFSKHENVSYKSHHRKSPKSLINDNPVSYSGQGTLFPKLTIPNLAREIERNNIKYPKIVLAQAILETGWFQSNVCRTKNNLFGLTCPKTGKYYEFNHWTESVRAYYTKVQYKYCQKNNTNESDVDYLIWLRDLPYATDKNYIFSLIKILKSLSSY